MRKKNRKQNNNEKKSTNNKNISNKQQMNKQHYFIKIKYYVKKYLKFIIMAVLVPIFGYVLNDVYKDYISQYIFPPIMIYPSEIELQRGYENSYQVINISNVSDIDQNYVNIGIYIEDNVTNKDEINIKQNKYETKDKSFIDGRLSVGDIDLLISKVQFNNEKEKIIRLIIPFFKSKTVQSYIISYKNQQNSVKTGTAKLKLKQLTNFDGPLVEKLSTQNNPIDVDPFSIRKNTLRKYSYLGKDILLFRDKDKHLWFEETSIKNVLSIGNIIYNRKGVKTKVTLIDENGNASENINAISEGGVSSLINELNSNEAKNFQEWYLHEIQKDMFK